MPKILIIDDQDDLRWFLSNFLLEEGFEILIAENGEVGLEQVRKNAPEVVLLDLKMPQLDGIATLEQIKEIDPSIPVIIITAYGDIRSAVQAMKLHAYDYLTKPFDNQDLLFTIKRALERQQLLSQVETLRNQIQTGSVLQDIMGSSPQIQKVLKQIYQVARSSFTVIIQGETGTGKEIVARAIHQQSERSQKPFVALDCGAIPETLIESELFGYEKGAFTGANQRRDGHFQLAHRGTLFLDEIANLPLTTQSKLLRAVQEWQIQPLGAKQPIPVDLRLIVASNTTLGEAVKAGRFRQDLYHRLNEFTVTIPPLRERREDIVHLARRFLEEANLELRKEVRGFSKEAIQFLLSYPWPGNVRELRNMIRRAVLQCEGIIVLEHLSAVESQVLALPSQPEAELDIQAGLSLKEITGKAAAEVEERVIQQILKATRGNKSQAARLLKIDYKTLYSKLKRHGIRSGEFLP